MKVITVSFFGHRILDNPFPVERLLEKFIHKLLIENEYVEFLVGRDGEFDQLVSSVVRRCKRTLRADNSSLVWVMPYLIAEYRDNEEVFRQYYDEIEISKASAGKHFKSAFQARNHEMVDRSDLAVFYVQREKGGAYQTMMYAKKQHKFCINLCERKTVCFGAELPETAAFDTSLY